MRVQQWGLRVGRLLRTRSPPSFAMADPRTVLQHTRSVAVLGAHTDPHRPATSIPAYLVEQGLTVFLVNPRFVGQEALGTRFLASLADLPSPVDLVNVFRPSSALPGHLPELLALQPPPRSVWLQLGIHDATVAATLEAHGIGVVQNRCILVDHRRFGLEAR